MKRKISLLAIVALASVLTGACQADGNGASVVEYHGDYPTFSSAQELNSAADTVIEGQIIGTSVQEITLRPQGGGSPEQDPAAGTGRDPAADALTMVYTVSKVSVTKVHKGTVKAGDVLVIKQPGGQFKGVDYRAERLSLPATSSYLMFLETYPDGTPASLLNQSQAAFTVAADGSYVAGPGNDLAVSAETLSKS